MKVKWSLVAAFVYGATLGLLGFPFTTWQFWVLVPLAVIWVILATLEQQP